MAEMTPKEVVLGLLRGDRVDRVPCFSGMANITVTGIKQLGYRFSELHGDAGKMAEAAASTPEMFGYDCAVVPFDICVEAEVLGCEMNPYPHADHILFPTIKQKVVESEGAVGSLTLPAGIEKLGRVPLVADAIKRLKGRLGEKIPVGAYVLGPFLIAGQIADLEMLLKLSFKKMDLVNGMLEKLARLVVELVHVYQRAGADYVCIREMSSGTDILSPRQFKSLVQPHLQAIFRQIDIPNILHICGNTNQIVKFMVDCGADAIAVEQANDLAKTREDVGPEPLVFGNIDPVGVLSRGTPAAVEEAVRRCLEGGVDAVMPGCDLWPEVPPENMRALVEATRRLGTPRHRK